MTWASWCLVSRKRCKTRRGKCWRTQKGSTLAPHTCKRLKLQITPWFSVWFYPISCLLNQKLNNWSSFVIVLHLADRHHQMIWQSNVFSQVLLLGQPMKFGKHGQYFSTSCFFSVYLGPVSRHRLPLQQPHLRLSQLGRGHRLPRVVEKKVKGHSSKIRWVILLKCQNKLFFFT